MNGLPDFLIIGASRCGTTSLHGYLCAHKELEGPKYMSSLKAKELHFFDHCYAASIDWYASQFPQPQENGKLYFESTPDYIFEPAVPKRVKYWMPDCKFIAMLRDPVDRAWSHFYFYWMHIYGMKIDHLIEAMEKVTYSTREVPKVPLQRRSFYRNVQCGMYVKMLKRWFGAFPAKQGMIIQSEDFFAAPQMTIDQVCEFLGVCGMKLGQFPVLDPLKNLAGSSYPAIPADLEKRLTEFYRPHNEELYRFLGYEMRGWRR